MRTTSKIQVNGTIQSRTVVPKTFDVQKIQGVKKKTSIGNSALSRGAGTNKRKTKKKYRGQGK